MGRLSLDSFDYSADNVRRSVVRSCKRLNSDYLDLVYLHDVEFVNMKDSLVALRELKKLKNEGIIKRFGISGYPVDYLFHLSSYCAKKDTSIGPLDAILSYCNLNLQNITLSKYREKFESQCQVKMISNASVLSMSLLRRQETKQFHPASQELRKCSDRAAKYCHDNGVDLAKLALRYAITKWIPYGPTIIGVSSVEELQDSLKTFQEVQSGVPLSSKEIEMVETIQSKIFGSHLA